MALSDDDKLEILAALQKVGAKSKRGAAGLAAAAKPEPAGGGADPARFAEAMQNIESALSAKNLKARKAQPLAASGPAAGAGPLASSQFCQAYGAIEPYLEIALEGIEWLPYGSTIAKVIRLLEKAADVAC